MHAFFQNLHFSACLFPCPDLCLRPCRPPSLATCTALRPTPSPTTKPPHLPPHPRTRPPTRWATTWGRWLGGQRDRRTTAAKPVAWFTKTYQVYSTSEQAQLLGLGLPPPVALLPDPNYPVPNTREGMSVIILDYCDVLIYVAFFFWSSAQGVIERTRENPGNLKVHLCTAQAHSGTELTTGPCIMLA